MPRTNRIQPAGVVFHVLNRGNDRRALFEKTGDYAAFLKAMAQTQEHVPVSLLAYCVMPNHWHLVVRPENDGDLGKFMQRLTVTHVQRWRAHRQSAGLGHLYQGTYKSFPVQEDAHFLAVCRYVERNALRARLVGADKAQEWPWSSLWQRQQGLAGGSEQERPVLTQWPVAMPKNWPARVNQAETAEELEALRTSVKRGRPLGTQTWTSTIAQRLELTSTLRTRGRPRQAAKAPR